MSIKNGVYVALVTPFNKNNTICWSSLEKLINFHIEKNTTGLVLLGTTGEAPTLTYTEKTDIIDFVYKKADKKIDIVVGVGGNNTEEVKQLAIYCQNKGVADSLMVTVPNYNKPTQEGIYQHFKQIADYVKLPIMMYNIPSRCGVNMTPETVEQIYGDCDNVVAIKEASGSLEQAIKIKSLCDINIFSGDDSLILPILAIGGVGVISVASNILPWEISHIVSEFNNNIELSRKLYFKFHNFIKALFVTTNPVPVKYLLSKIDLINNDIVRLPLVKDNDLEVKMKGVEDFLKEYQMEKQAGGRVEPNKCPMVV